MVIVVVACLSLFPSFSLSSFTRLLLWPSPLSVDFLVFCLGVSCLVSRVRVLPVLGMTLATFGQTMDGTVCCVVARLLILVFIRALEGPLIDAAE